MYRQNIRTSHYQKRTIHEPTTGSQPLMDQYSMYQLYLYFSIITEAHSIFNFIMIIEAAQPTFKIFFVTGYRSQQCYYRLKKSDRKFAKSYLTPLTSGSTCYVIQSTKNSNELQRQRQRTRLARFYLSHVSFMKRNWTIGSSASSTKWQKELVAVNCSIVYD